MKPSSATASPCPMRGDQRQRGFALLITLVIVVMGSLFVVTSQLEFASRKYSRDEANLKSLTLAKDALIGWAINYRDRNNAVAANTPVFGYLPCPDSLTGDGSVTFNCSAANLAAVGLLPYQALGLPDLRDADGNCLWYAVSGTFKNDLMATSTLMNWDAQGQFQILDSSGNTLAAPNDANGGAAAVIIAPGAPLATQDRNGTGPAQSQPCNVNPANQQALSSYLDGGYTFATFAVTGANNTITLTQGTRGSSTNNDLLVWITPKEIFDLIKKRSDFTNIATGTPVGQINNFIELAKSTLESRIFDDITNNGGTPRSAAPYLTTPTNQAAYTQGTAWQIGELPSLKVGNYVLTDGSYNSYYDNWNDQFRYLLCSNLNNYCLTINGLKCDGALLFGGESTSLSSTGGPRPTTARQLANYFESALTLASGGSTSSYAGTQDTYSTTTRSTDVVRCLYTRALSFSQDLASFQTVKSAGTTVTTVAGTSVTLATTGTGGAAGTNYGCFWYPTAVPFGNGVRIYFRFRFTSKSEGFTFALADATSNPTTQMCGAGDAAIGYSGNNGSGTIIPIKYPKLGVEFDTKTDAAYNDPSSGGVSTRHITFDYWGNSAGDPNGTDDNVHGNGGSNGDPVNPVSSTTACTTVGGGNKFCRNAMSNNQNHDVHIDITRAYSSTTGQGIYTLKAYFAFNGSYVNCPFAVLTNVAADASASCNPAISDTITITDLAGAGEAMKRVFLGFTTSQGTANQSVVISNLQIMPN
ncbi:MAG: hypothetical protein NT159_08310 [Proteobacteria bacterium]|nr:hypothetical protein [Pseudomonadota bacterium]